MTALRIQPTPLIDLLPAGGSTRAHPVRTVRGAETVARDDPRMLEARPVIALPDGTVVCGNQRLLAARELGWETIPAVTVDLDGDQARLWMLRDNNEYGEWEDDALAELLRELEAGAADLKLTGFPESELEYCSLSPRTRGETLTMCRRCPPRIRRLGAARSTRWEGTA